MSSLKTILLVDDSPVSRKALLKILSGKYAVLEAENGQSALKLLHKCKDEIAAVMLDLVMPVMDGYAVLKAIRSKVCYVNLPVVVITGKSDRDSEIKALIFGAWDFVSKPYDPEIVMFRLKNAIERSQLSALKQLKYLAEYDALTGIYNKDKFFNRTRKMIDTSPEESFVFLRFDVDRFQLINSFFGTEEGDRLLQYIARYMAEDVGKYSKATYGRIESDIFALCVPYERTTVENMVCQSKKTLAQFDVNYDIVPSVGIYVIEDDTISVEEMYNRATLAAKTCKGNYVEFYAYYDEGMSAALSAEQEITNDMNYALESGQFEIYLQPQYNIHTNLPCGAEALCRWIHPQKGMILPGSFIPVFERNGFITKLDYYVWEQVCQCLHGWISKGIQPYPISVNISRVNLYNPNLVETLLKLVKRYQIEPALLHLELTESAYSDNPSALKKVVTQLQEHGFLLMMDDFGSGYSSLALLKDISIDVLKIDMHFLSETEVPGRGENIIASVIRMAKWLNIPIIAEGAETTEQVDFLRSVGCDYVQGYYFAHPMPVSEYEQLCSRIIPGTHLLSDSKQEVYSYDDLFSLNPEMKLLFGNLLQAAVIYEFADDQIEMIRVNEAYYALLGHDDMLKKASNLLSLLEEEYRTALHHAFCTVSETHQAVECEYRRFRTGRTPIWIHTKLSYATTVGNKHIIIGELTDITLHKELDSELQRYRESWLSGSHNTHTVLIVDDVAIDRTILKKILQNEFLFLEAENGAEAIKILRENQNKVDLILSDISMPVMDGKKFLQHKKNLPELDGIPVIMITADDSPEQQASAFSMGANDYIIKPFIPEVVTRRVKNVLESNHRFKEMVREYNTMSAQVKTDLITGLLNRIGAQELISQQLKRTAGTCMLLLLDVDNLKRINDSFWRDYSDKAICAIANRLRVHFTKADIVSRMNGDEFAVFVENIPSVDRVRQNADQLIQSISEIEIDGKKAGITCSVGISVSDDKSRSFETLYQNADKALYSAKCQGGNIVSVYGEESVFTSVGKWIDDADSVLDAMNDSVYVCDRDTYEMIYANDKLCKMRGITREACKGKKCYELLMQQTIPCEFCTMGEMVENKVYTRLFRVPDSSQVFLMQGKTINQSGTMVHLEVALDVTEIEIENLQWDEVANFGKE